MSTVAAALIFGFLIATVYGAGFHLFTGGPLRRIPIFLIASWIGFIIGHFLGDFMGLAWLRLGVLQLFSASLGSWTFLLFSRWLVAVE